MTSASYRVVDEDGCTLVFGPVPITVFVALTERHSPTSIVSTHLARLAEASFAFGEPKTIDQMVAHYSSVQRVALRHKHCDLPEEAIEWLVGPDVGVSSLTLLSAATGVLGLIDPADASPPRDTADFIRCRKLIEAVPQLRDTFDKVGALSPVWARLVGSWDALCHTLDGEHPSWKQGESKAPRTERLLTDLGC